MITDPIGDLIIRLKNAGMVGHTEVSLPYSKLKEAVLETLKKNGYIKDFEKHGKGVKKSLKISLFYNTDKTPRISAVKRISKPGRRIYKDVKNIFPVRYGKGIMIISTSKGVMTNNDAVKEKVGGEILFEIW